MKKRVLFLGGASYQLPAIHEALRRGDYVILCSNNPLDPGVELADEYHNISISDHEAVIKLAELIDVNYVLGYVSETAMKSASAVTEALGLPGVNGEVLQTCIRKDLFRNFQATHEFAYPNYIVVSEGHRHTPKEDKLRYPLIVKPVDSCGSRGVSRIERKENLPPALTYAFKHSSNKLAIIEEEVSANNRQFTGDGFMINGHLAFFSFGEHLFDTKTSRVTACGSLWPAKVSSIVNHEINHTIESHLSKIGYSDGPFNVDFRIKNDGEIIIIEIAPRNGANYFPQIIKHCTGVDLVAAILDCAHRKAPDFEIRMSNYAASFILYSTEDGVIHDISIARELERFILQKDIVKQTGDDIKSYQHLGNSAGIVNLGFKSASELKNIVSKKEHLINITLDKYIEELNST